MSSTKTRPRASRKPPAERAEDIAAAARALALEQGLSALTLRAVASRAGVAHALVVHYVASMDSLIADTYSSIAGAEMLEIVRILEAADTPRARIATLIRTVLDGTRDATTGVWVDGWGLGRRNETVAAAVREQSEAWQTVFAKVIEEGVAAGEFVASDPSAVAWLLLGMIDGVNAQALVRQDYESQRADLMCSVAERLLGLDPGALDG